VRLKSTNLSFELSEFYSRAYTIMDSSKVSTYLISILLIVYGSFRSLNMEQEAREREKEKERANLLTGITSNSATANSENPPGKGILTLDTMHVLCLPLGASISLLVMFFFFDSMQMLFAICTASEFSLLCIIYNFITIIIICEIINI
jgi:signal peptide peptidase-like protein 3